MESQSSWLDPQAEFPCSPAEQQSILSALSDELKLEAQRLIRILGAHGFTLRLSHDGVRYGQFNNHGELVLREALKPREHTGASNVIDHS
jgi:hypothetical protein